METRATEEAATASTGLDEAHQADIDELCQHHLFFVTEIGLMRSDWGIRLHSRRWSERNVA